MPNLTVNHFYRIEELIELVRDKKDRDSIYMIYIPASIEVLEAGMIVYVGNVPDFDDDDNEIIPAHILEQGLTQGYMREQFQDVVDLAYRQKKSASTEEVILCLNHYSKHDDFLDLQ